MSPHNKEILRNALELIERGFAVLALRYRSKKPHPKLSPHGVRSATTDPETVRAWFELGVKLNLGIAIDKKWCVVDVDPRNGGHKKLGELEKTAGRSLTSNVVQCTGGHDRGVHMLYGRPKSANLKNVADRRGLGLKLTGTYIVGPGSLHESGRRYKMVGGSLPEVLSLPMLPDEFVAYFQPSTKIAAVAAAVSVEGTRNDDLFRLGSSHRANGETRAGISAILRDQNAKSCLPPLHSEEVERIALNVSRQPHYDLTPGGNAQRFAAMFSQDLRYDYRERRWLKWDTQRWRVDDGLLLDTCVKEVIRAAYQEARACLIPETREKLEKHARHSDTATGHKAIKDLACSYFAIDSNGLDANPWLFNCSNGTIDLRTGKLREHRREDFITRMTRVPYKPYATSKRWREFLTSITGGDSKLERYLQRAVGYSMTGLTTEEKLFFVFGPAATGKSTFVDACLAVLGNYGCIADSDLFVRRRSPGAPRHDIARLEGARMVVTVEVEPGERLAEGLVKQLTGGDHVVARKLYAQSREFKPIATFWIVGNDRPIVRDDDSGIWRRIRTIPLDHVIPEGDRDPNIKRILTKNEHALQAILAWMIEGCLQWQKFGLKPPSRVTRATDDFQATMNPLADWIAEETEVGPDKSATPGELQFSYREFCRTHPGSFQLSCREFSQRLTSMGFVVEPRRVRGKPIRVRVGIGLIEK